MWPQTVNANLILCNFDHSLEKQTQYIRRLLLTGVDGIIIVPVLREHIQETKQPYSVMMDAKRPIVFCNMALDGIRAPIVVSNGFFGGYLATKHLWGIYPHSRDCNRPLQAGQWSGDGLLPANENSASPSWSEEEALL